MIYRMTTEADSGEGIDGAEVWGERLGWAYGLIAGDPAVRAAALVRLAEAGRNTRDALDRYNRTWRRRYSPTRKAASRNYEEIRTYSLPDALWDRPAGPGIVAWPGLPYALLFLEWEARYPQEWTRHAKAWGTKQGLIRDLAVAHHEETVRTKLADLTEIVVQRPYRCKDREYPEGGSDPACAARPRPQPPSGGPAVNCPRPGADWTGARAQARPLVEPGMARPRTRRVSRRSRGSPNRMTPIAAAALTLERQPREGSWSGWANGCSGPCRTSSCAWSGNALRHFEEG